MPPKSHQPHDDSSSQLGPLPTSWWVEDLSPSRLRREQERMRRGLLPEPIADYFDSQLDSEEADLMRGR